MKADQDHMLPVARSVPGESTPQPAQASGISSGPADLAGARDSVRTSSSDNTRRAYAGDWKHYTAWCRRQSLAVLPPDPRIVSLYLTACALGNVTGDKRPNSTSTIERRLSSLSWNYAQRGQPLDRKDLQITTVMARIRSTRAKPPARKEAVRQEDIIAMLETLDRGSLRGIRDRAILLIGFAGRLRRRAKFFFDERPVFAAFGTASEPFALLSAAVLADVNCCRLFCHKICKSKALFYQKRANFGGPQIVYSFL